MASAIFNYYRTNENGHNSDPDAEEETQVQDRTKALKNALNNYQQRLPRYLHLLLYNQSTSSTTSTSSALHTGHKSSSSGGDVPRLFYGETKILKKEVCMYDIYILYCIHASSILLYTVNILIYIYNLLYTYTPCICSYTHIALYSYILICITYEPYTNILPYIYIYILSHIYIYMHIG